MTLSLKKAYENICKAADVMSTAQADFSAAKGDSKYSEVMEIPDEIVDVIDYGNSNMTYEKFIELMNDALEELKND